MDTLLGHSHQIELGWFDCSEIYVKTSKNLREVVNPDHTTFEIRKST